MDRKPRQTRNRETSLYDPVVALLVANGVVTLESPEKGRRVAKRAKELGHSTTLTLRPQVTLKLNKIC